jgi:hypothetical protein
MTGFSDRPPYPIVNRTALWASVALFGLGGALCAAGAAVSVATTIGAARRWANRLDESPGQIARRRWYQAKKAAGAGFDVWRQEARPTTVPRERVTVG